LEELGERAPRDRSKGDGRIVKTGATGKNFCCGGLVSVTLFEFGPSSTTTFKTKGRTYNWRKTMKKVMTHVLTTLALIMTLGLTAYASDGHDFVRPNGAEATTTAVTKTAEGHPDRFGEGHPDRFKDGHR
jgi:hypothetical protein